MKYAPDDAHKINCKAFGSILKNKSTKKVTMNHKPI
jgi:hypothetical protein